MSFGLKRSELRLLAEAKYKDACLLFQHERYSNSYYLAGYAVGIGLKAALAVQFAAETIPDPKFVRTIYTHSLRDLVSAAGLTGHLKSKQTDDPQFRTNWGIVSDWSEEARYRSYDIYTARLMIEAVGSDGNGVLSWLRTNW